MWTVLRGCVSAAGTVARVSPRSLHTTGRVSRRLGNSRTVKPLLFELNRRSDIVELDHKLKNKDIVPRRSSFTDWNYAAEMKALQARLGETFDHNLLNQAMIMDSHLEIEMRKQEELGVDVSEEMKDNSELADRGREVIHSSITRWLRVAFPVVPEEMITELRDYLLSEPIMADVAFHIGLREIVLSEEYPPAAATLTKCFEAVVGALASSQPERAAKLVTDLVASQLHGKEVQEICSGSLANPMRILEGILLRSGLEAPEARLLFQTGPDTILASHLVGVYCNKEIIGQSYGETLEIAEEMAARDALRNIFQTAEHSAPRPFGQDTEGGDTPHADMGSMALEPRNIVNC